MPSFANSVINAEPGRAVSRTSPLRPYRFRSFLSHPNHSRYREGRGSQTSQCRSSSRTILGHRLHRARRRWPRQRPLVARRAGHSLDRFHNGANKISTRNCQRRRIARRFRRAQMIRGSRLCPCRSLGGLPEASRHRRGAPSRIFGACLDDITPDAVRAARALWGRYRIKSSAIIRCCRLDKVLIRYQ